METLSWYESARVRNMTPAQRTIWHEYGRVDKIHHKLKNDFETNRISDREFSHRFKKEVVDVRKALLVEERRNRESGDYAIQDGPVNGDTPYSICVISKSGHRVHLGTTTWVNKKAAEFPQPPWQKNGF